MQIFGRFFLPGGTLREVIEERHFALKRALCAGRLAVFPAFLELRAWHSLSKEGFVMKTQMLSVVRGVLAAALLPLYAGCVAPAPEADVTVSEPPPAQVEVVPPTPDPTFVWVGGSWEWHNHWVWQAGRWAPSPHPGAVWVHGAWAKHGNHRVWVRSHWM